MRAGLLLDGEVAAIVVGAWAPAMPTPVMAVAEAATAMMPMKRKLSSFYVAVLDDGDRRGR